MLLFFITLTKWHKTTTCAHFTGCTAGITLTHWFPVHMEDILKCNLRTLDEVNSCELFVKLLYGESWWRHQMETFSVSLDLCAGYSLVTGEFPSQRPVTRSFDVVFGLPLNKRLSKQSWDWCSLWRHSNGAMEHLWWWINSGSYIGYVPSGNDKRVINPWILWYLRHYNMR